MPADQQPFLSLLADASGGRRMVLRQEQVSHEYLMGIPPELQQRLRKLTKEEKIVEEMRVFAAECPSRRVRVGFSVDGAPATRHKADTEQQFEAMKPNLKVLAGLFALFVATQAHATRWYSPSTGRWFSRDPIGEQGGMNLYAFGYNDLVNTIDPFGLWTRDTWTGGWDVYTGMATAECGDTLSELARLITGRSSDWTALGIPETIRVGQKVNIAPLLVVLENRMRNNVVSATSSFNAAFGLPVPPFQGLGSEEVNRFFDDGSGVQADCTAAAYIVLAKGLLDTITTRDFDALGYHSQSYPIKRKTMSVGQMKLGDWAYFQNYADYMQVAGGAWQGENVIKTGQDRYWGHGGGVRSQSSWYSLLRQSYNQESGQNRSDPIPGYTGDANFVDVATVGMGTFDVRKSRRP